MCSHWSLRESYSGTVFANQVKSNSYSFGSFTCVLRHYGDKTRMQLCKKLTGCAWRVKSFKALVIKSSRLRNYKQNWCNGQNVANGQDREKNMSFNNMDLFCKLAQCNMHECCFIFPGLWTDEENKWKVKPRTFEIPAWVVEFFRLRNSCLSNGNFNFHL